MPGIFARAFLCCAILGEKLPPLTVQPLANVNGNFFRLINANPQWTEIVNICNYMGI